MDGITAEIPKVGGDKVIGMHVKVCNVTLQTVSIPQDWSTMIFNPIHKNGINISYQIIQQLSQVKSKKYC